MDLTDVREKLRRKNHILFSRNSLCLQELLQLMRQQKRRTLVLWALTGAQVPVEALRSRYPEDTRPQTALTLCWEWARGKIKMPIAKKALLQVHAMAQELSSPVDIALCHAIGQACGAVHVETHAIGLAIYELTAIVYQLGIQHCEQAVADKISSYCSLLLRCAQEIEVHPGPWAKFLLEDTHPNREQLLLEKQSGLPKGNNMLPTEGGKS